MADPLRVLDDAIDRLASAVSSRCSRSVEPGGMPTGTVNALKVVTVPVVPVVPVQNGRICGANFSRPDSPCLDSSRKKNAHASTILKRTGTTGTTGTGITNQRLTVPVADSENGNNGNCHQGAEPSGCQAGMVGRMGDGMPGMDGYLIVNTILNQYQECPDRSATGLQDGLSNDLVEASVALHLPGDTPPQMPPDRPRIDLPQLPGVPQAWLTGLALMARMAAPAGVTPADWEGMVAGATRLLENWGAQLAALGWTTADLFAVHRFRPMNRNDCAGLVRFVGHNDIRAVTATTVTLRTASGATQTFYRRAPSDSDWIMMWELGDRSRRA